MPLFDRKMWIPEEIFQQEADVAISECLLPLNARWRAEKELNHLVYNFDRLRLWWRWRVGIHQTVAAMWVTQSKDMDNLSIQLNSRGASQCINQKLVCTLDSSFPLLFPKCVSLPLDACRLHRAVKKFFDALREQI